ncbi:Gfo/Idh/MocA family oxidoreductase [Halomonas sp. EGI 63088]|uniref:Gfo/Idh/MocA family oxidoreductase n=1 Tax=Halomonas flagellata TaxID=2920385 RepID=A0ABS9RWP3_9GAMM|nr:Gfo/Idh/MocA family oxidoreductase [Halomonas flagellata]MCH4564257.1 Gfo/Idh/MocA family oxidoreductase [Halomonas flagellata]
MSADRIRIGMVGGGPGAGIAKAHRMGMRLDDRYALVAGVFSRSLEKSRQAAAKLGVDETRVYADFEQMAREEAAREDGIEVVAIVTPNDSHYPVARAFLEAGIHVICDKPMTGDLEEAERLNALAAEKGRVFVLTHNYSAYAMVREAARRVRDGALGELRIAMVEHASGWAASLVEADASNKQAAWRLDPAQSGEESLIFDLGTHAHQLLRFVSGLEVTEVSAELHTCVPGRRVYDDAQVQVRLANGARGTLWASMAATGHEHGLRIRLFGDKASLEWRQMDPHYLTLNYPGGRRETLVQGHDGQSPDQARLTRVGLGHPEGFIESFANLYGDVAEAIHRYRETGQAAHDDLPLPGSRDGLLGVRFVKAVGESHAAQGRWVHIPL